MSDARVAVSWRRCQNTYFTIQETLEARLHRLSGVKVPKATGVLWPTKFILTVPLLARLSGMDGARAMFPLSCARARARTAFQSSAHSIFSVPTNLKSFHYYFEVIFCPLFSLRSRKTAVSSYIRHPCTKVVDYTQWTKV